MAENQDKENLPVREGKQLLDKTEAKSSEILDAMKVKGKTTEPGASATDCSNSSDEGTFRGVHLWSMSGVPLAELRQAMDRLRRDLPKKGWKIVKDGHDRSRSRSPQILAESQKDRFSADIRLRKRGGDGSKDPSVIQVTVASACYREK